MWLAEIIDIIYLWEGANIAWSWSEQGVKISWDMTNSLSIEV